MIAQSLTWQFQINQAIDIVQGSTSTNPAVNDRLLMIGLVGSMLGRNAWVDKDNVASVAAGNWTCRSSNDGAGNFGNNDGVNWWDTAGVLDPTKLVWANPGTNHSWMALRQTGIGATYEVLIDLRVGGTSTSASVTFSETGFGLANGGADGTATAAPTAAAGSFQTLINATSWGGGALLGTVWHAMKTTDGHAYRFFATRSNAVIAAYMFEVPDPVVAGWTNPSIAQAIGHSTVTEQLTYTRLNGFNTYSRTPGGTIFSSAWGQDGSQSDTNIRIQPSTGFGGVPNEVDGTDTVSDVVLYSATVNARNVNGMLKDVYWGNTPGITYLSLAGQTLPAGGPEQWARFGDLWVPWPASNVPRMQI